MGMQPLLTNAQQQSEWMLTQAPITQVTAEELKASQKKAAKTNQENILRPVFMPDLSLSQKEPQNCPAVAPKRDAPPCIDWWSLSPLVLSLQLPNPLLQCQRCRESYMMQAHNLRRMKEFRPTPQCFVREAGTGQILWPTWARQNCKRQKADGEAADQQSHNQ